MGRPRESIRFAGARRSEAVPNRVRPRSASAATTPPQLSIDQPISRQRQKLLELVGEGHVREEPDRLGEASALERSGANLRLDALHLARERSPEHVGGDLAAVVELRPEVNPLPDL